MASVQEAQSQPAKRVTVWLVLGLVFFFGCVYAALLLPVVADAGSSEEIQLASRLSLSIYFPLGVLSLVTAIRRAYQNPPQSFAPRRSHTILVGVLGTLFLLFGFVSAFEPSPDPDIFCVLRHRHGLLRSMRNRGCHPPKPSVPTGPGLNCGPQHPLGSVASFRHCHVHMVGCVPSQAGSQRRCGLTWRRSWPASVASRSGSLGQLRPGPDRGLGQAGS